MLYVYYEFHVTIEMQVHSHLRKLSCLNLGYGRFPTCDSGHFNRESGGILNQQVVPRGLKKDLWWSLES